MPSNLSYDSDGVMLSKITCNLTCHSEGRILCLKCLAIVLVIQKVRVYA